jgi:hypothetical protein
MNPSVHIDAVLGGETDEFVVAHPGDDAVVDDPGKFGVRSARKRVNGGVAVASGVILFSCLDAGAASHPLPAAAIWYGIVLGWQLLESNLRLATRSHTPGNERTRRPRVPDARGKVPDAVITSSPILSITPSRWHVMTHLPT